FIYLFSFLFYVVTMLIAMPFSFTRELYVVQLIFQTLLKVTCNVNILLNITLFNSSSFNSFSIR
ncbi:hypothetical protein L9F63_012297, partial [Diploptera punctata]